MDRIERAIHSLKNSSGNKLIVSNMANVLEEEIKRLNEWIGEYTEWHTKELAEIERLKAVIKNSGMNIDFNDQDTRIILELAEKKGLKIKPLMQQALRLYQIIDGNGSVCRILSVGKPSKTELLVT